MLVRGLFELRFKLQAAQALLPRPPMLESVNTLQYMRQVIAPWGRPLDIALITGTPLADYLRPDLSMLQNQWWACGAGEVHLFEKPDDALAATMDSIENWLSAISADAMLPSTSPIGLIAADYEPFALEDRDMETARLTHLFKQLYKAPVARALVCSEDFAVEAIRYFDAGLIDVCLPWIAPEGLGGQATMDPSLAPQLSNLVFNRMAAKIPGVWNSRPYWLVNADQNAVIAGLLREKSVCSWEWISDPDRLLCKTESGEELWLYLQTAEERRAASMERAPSIGGTGTVQRIYSRDETTLVINLGESAVTLDGKRLLPDVDTYYAWSDQELSPALS